MAGYSGYALVPKVGWSISRITSESGLTIDATKNILSNAKILAADFPVTASSPWTPVVIPGMDFPVFAGEVYEIEICALVLSVVNGAYCRVAVKAISGAGSLKGISRYLQSNGLIGNQGVGGTLSAGGVVQVIDAYGYTTEMPADHIGRFTCTSSGVIQLAFVCAQGPNSVGTIKADSLFKVTRIL